MFKKVISTNKPKRMTLKELHDFARPKEKSFRDLQVLAIEKQNRPAKEFRYLGMSLQEWNKVEWWLNGN